jgi:hypothetical protein
MRKKWFVTLTAALIAAALVMPMVMAQEPPRVQSEASAPKLTKKQQKEIQAIYEQMWKLKKQLILKYKDCGVIDQEKAEKIIKHMETKKKMIEKNGYLPIFERGHKGKKGKDKGKFPCPKDRRQPECQ